MIPQAIVGMLACARLGAIHTVVFGGFAANELAKRITDCKPALVLSASCGLEPNRIIKYKPLLDEALRISEHAVRRCVIVQRRQCQAELMKERDVEWGEFCATGSSVPPVPVPSSHPLYILYTSGKVTNALHATVHRLDMYHVAQALTFVHLCAVCSFHQAQPGRRKVLSAIRVGTPSL